jgi:hypothetical protein
VLAKIAIEELSDYWARTSAFEKLTDQTLLATIARQAKYSACRSEAVKKLTDQTVLAKIAVEDENSVVRQYAIETLTDQTLLAKIALSSSDYRDTAIKKLTDQTVLAKIAVEDESSVVRRLAVETLTPHVQLDMLTDQSLLAMITLETNDSSVGAMAATKLTDQAVPVFLNMALWRYHDATTPRRLEETLIKLLRDNSSRLSIDVLQRISTLRPIVYTDVIEVDDRLMSVTKERRCRDLSELAMKILSQRGSA